MTFLTKEFGKIEMDDILAYYDFPRAFSGINEKGELFFCYHTDELPYFFRWLIVPMTKKEYHSLSDGKISIYHAVKTNEAGYVWDLIDPHQSPEQSAIKIICKNLSDDLLPDKSVTFERK